MRPNQDETYEAWLERARMYEHGLALQRIAKGEDRVKVMEDMGRRFMEKAMHPILKTLRESANTPYDAEKSRREYEEKMKKIGPAADHVDGNLFDKPDEI